MRKFTLPLLAACVGILAAPVLSMSAHAATVSVSGSYGPVTTDWSGSSNYVSVPQFNSSLGTLTAVSVSITETVNGSATVSSGDAQTITATPLLADSAIMVLDPTQALGTCNLIYANCFGVELTGADAQILNVPNATYTSAQVFNFTNVTATSGDAYSTTNFDTVFSSGGSAYLSTFTGGGNVQLTLLTSTFLQGSISGGDPQIAQTTTDAATVNVTYTYDTPEPATLAIFGGALAALGAIRRRKASR